MTRGDFLALLERIQAAEREVCDDGQREYAHDEGNALANFERAAEAAGITREAALTVLLSKHMDGIAAWIKGHRSQREDVRGRIKDARLYLALLWAMVEETS